MTSLRTQLGDQKKRTSQEFTDYDKKVLFYFLDKYKEDDLALDFVQRWFNCTQTTLIMLAIKREGI